MGFPKQRTIPSHKEEKEEEKEQEPFRIWDMTAGLGKDSILLALAGAHVTLMERDPIVSTLLSDAMRRLLLVAAVEEEDKDWEKDDSLSKSTSKRIALAKTLSKRMTFRPGDGISLANHFLQQRQEQQQQPQSQQGQDRKEQTEELLPPPLTAPHVCYLDPMFPPRTKSSAVKKKCNC